MPEFSSFADLAKHLDRVSREIPKTVGAALEKVGKRVESTAKDKIGHYQDASGEFPAWPELKDTTKADRLRKGFTENDPELRTGELYGSITHDVSRSGTEHKLTVGSDLDIALWQEMGTDHIPPRPFIGPAMFENEASGQEIIGKSIEKLFEKAK